MTQGRASHRTEPDDDLRPLPSDRAAPPIPADAVPVLDEADPPDVADDDVPGLADAEPPEVRRHGRGDQDDLAEDEAASPT